MTRIFVDMDGTLAKWRTDVPYEAIFEEHYFDTLPPQGHVVQAVKNLVKDPEFDVYILSAVLSKEEAPTALRDKNAWLDEYLPEIGEDHRIFCPCSVPKEDYIEGGIREGDVLLDDYSKNLHEWSGIGVKLINDVNATRGTWMGERVGYRDSPENIVRKIKDTVRHPLEHFPEAESIVIIPADRTRPEVFFKGTDEGFEQAEKTESDRINAWTDILNRKSFSALSFEREHDFLILSRSSKPDVFFQLTWFSRRDGRPNMDATFGGKKAGHDLQELPAYLYKETRSTGARVRILCEKECPLEQKLDFAERKAYSRKKNAHYKTVEKVRLL